MSTPTWNTTTQPTGSDTAAYPSHIMEGHRDVELYLAACDGDRDAVTELVECHQSSLLSIARAMGLQDAEAKDVVQLVWFKLFQHLKAVGEGSGAPLRNPAGIRAWLATTTRNAVRDVYRKRRPTVPIHSVPDDGDRPSVDPPDPVDITEGIEERELLRAAQEALAKLDEKCQELLALCVADPPLSYEEIGTILERSVGSLGPTRARCLEKLRTFLKGVGYE